MNRHAVIAIVFCAGLIASVAVSVVKASGGHPCSVVLEGVPCDPANQPLENAIVDDPEDTSLEQHQSTPAPAVPANPVPPVVSVPPVRPPVVIPPPTETGQQEVKAVPARPEGYLPGDGAGS